jgi:hypothetical protein
LGKVELCDTPGFGDNRKKVVTFKQMAGIISTIARPIIRYFAKPQV